VKIKRGFRLLFFIFLTGGLFFPADSWPESETDEVYPQPITQTQSEEAETSPDREIRAESETSPIELPVQTFPAPPSPPEPTPRAVYPRLLTQPVSGPGPDTGISVTYPPENLGSEPTPALPAVITQLEIPESASRPVIVLFPCGGKEGIPNHFLSEYHENLYQTLVALGIYRLVENIKVEDVIHNLNLSPYELEQNGGLDAGKTLGANGVLNCFVDETAGGDKYSISLKSRSFTEVKENRTASGKISKIYQPEQLQNLNDDLACQIGKCSQVQVFQRKKILLVVDSSNSMRKFGGNDIYNRRRSGAKLILNYIKRNELSNIELGIIDFSDRVHFSVCPMNVSDHFSELDSAIDRIGAQGGETNFDLCLGTAYDCLKDTGPEVQNYIFFLTDGFHNVGEYQNLHRLFNPKYNPEIKNNAPIFVMGLGADARNPNPQSEQGLDENLLSRIARESGGKDYIPIFSAEDIQAVFVSLVELEVMYRKGVVSDVVKGIKRGEKKSFQFQGGGDIFIYVEEKSEFSYEVKDPKGNIILINSNGSYRIINPQGQNIPRENYPPIKVSIFQHQASFIRLANGYYGGYQVAIKGQSGIPSQGTNLHYMVSTAERLDLEVLRPEPGYVHNNLDQDIHFRIGLADLPRPIVKASARVLVFKENQKIEEFPFGPFRGQDSNIDFFYSGTHAHGWGHYRFKFEIEGQLAGGIFFQRFRESNILAAVPKTVAAEKRQEVVRIQTAAGPDRISQIPAELTKIYFMLGNDEISPEARPVLQRLVKWLQGHPRTRIRLEGHGDDLGSQEYIYQLGFHRASKVKEFVRSQILGFDPSRIEIVSKGRNEPLASGPSFAMRWKNRRVEVKILPAS
jgi:outer membrane protein OmpA-like peptidoglycan-associated protein